MPLRVQLERLELWLRVEWNAKMSTKRVEEDEYDLCCSSVQEVSRGWRVAGKLLSRPDFGLEQGWRREELKEWWEGGEGVGGGGVGRKVLATMSNHPLANVEPAGNKVLEAFQGFVEKLMRSWDREHRRRALDDLMGNRGIETVVAWMNEQRRRIKQSQQEHRERQALQREIQTERKRKMTETVTLRDDDVKVAIITTASLPWMTGTAVNPLLRAAYLGRLQKKVTLLVPWLSPSDQEQIHPDGRVFDSPEDQEDFVRKWLRNRVGFEGDFKLTFYPGKYHPEKGSIFAVGDITQYIPDSEAQIAVLEEPEHLNWYHVGRRWCDKFKHVVGVVHTNYLEYVRREENGQLKENVLRVLNDWVVRAAGVHTVVKLSDAVQEFKKAETCFVHGVSPKFLDVGRLVAAR